MRTFEVPACGGFLLTERSEEQSEFFDEGTEIECFSSLPELRQKIDYYLRNSSDRIGIALAGYEEASKSASSFEARAKQMLLTYRELKEQCTFV